MEVIIDAKERQAAEANKNATILLQEIDLEKVFIVCYLHVLGYYVRSLYDYIFYSAFLFRNMRRTAKQLLQGREQRRKDKRKRNKHSSKCMCVCVCVCVCICKCVLLMVGCVCLCAYMYFMNMCLYVHLYV